MRIGQSNNVTGFQWFQYYKYQDGVSDTYGKANQSCALVHDSFIAFVDTSPTTTPSGDPDKLISFFDVSQLAYANYDPSRTSYTTPLEVQLGINGQNTPSGGFVSGLKPIFSTSIYSSRNSSSTAAPAATPARQSHTGAIVGGVVGGIVGLLLLAALAWWLVRQRRRKQNSTVVNHETPFPVPPPAPGTIPKPYQPPMSEFDSSQLAVHELGGTAAPYKPAIPPQELPGSEPWRRS